MKNAMPFMEPEYLLRFSQEVIIGLQPKPD
jgi:hypothetical protein